METKTHINDNILSGLLFLILFSTQLFAITEKQQLQDWTKKNEAFLVDKYQFIESDWFKQECLQLAKIMEFNKINQCNLFQSGNINAYVFDNGHVYFSSAMMKLINNKHQWASILAHENAHIELQHYLKTLRKIKKPGVFFPKKRIKKLLIKHEKEADMWSENVLKKFNFNTEQIYFFLQRVKKIKGAKKNHRHLNLSKRIKATKKKEIINQKLINRINFLVIPKSRQRNAN